MVRGRQRGRAPLAALDRRAGGCGRSAQLEKFALLATQLQALHVDLLATADRRAGQDEAGRQLAAAFAVVPRGNATNMAPLATKTHVELEQERGNVLERFRESEFRDMTVQELLVGAGPARRARSSAWLNGSVDTYRRNI
jgi:hypothetical protein